MAVRPFYIESDIEGRKTMLSGGPKNRHGGISTTIYQRDEGAITQPFKIEQYSVEEEGKLKLITEVYQHPGKKIATHITYY